MLIANLQVSNTYSSSRKDRQGNITTYPAAVRVKTQSGIILAEVIVESRSHDPLGFMRKRHNVNKDAMQARKSLIEQLTASDIATSVIDAILKP